MAILQKTKLFLKSKICLKLKNFQIHWMFYCIKKIYTYKISLMQVGVSDFMIFRETDQIVVHTNLSDPDPEPLLLSEEELSLLLSFSESDPVSLPDSDSNVFWKSIISTTCNFDFIRTQNIARHLCCLE